MRILWLPIAAFFLLTACDTPSDTERPASKRQIYFTEFPSDLYAAAEASCRDNADMIRSSSKSQLICEAHPPPQIAANLIAAHQGTLDDLPLYVMSLNTKESPGGFITTLDFHTRVPREDGKAILIRTRDPRANRAMERLIRMSGGRSVPG
ncbi:hypothetical protein [Parasulfitobacter algicola]|uniref:Lipoprotein n=1 Tax=Parasulfitobacter algicola TaxID=2614809 RepID=A0ABX2ITL2_9RHOB|nr:hypothetical protein [Sulfitobacter algicola]NSX55670.1 hypothetical protein [Sulfitobacter algicola]